MTKEDTLTVSSSFFDPRLLVQCFQDLVELTKEYEKITMEDDRQWLSIKL